MSDRLRFAGFLLKRKKCVFAMKQVKYLGHVVSQEDVMHDAAELEKLKAFPRPTDRKTVR